MVRAGVVLGKKNFFPVNDIHQGKATGEGGGGFDGIGEAGADLRLNHQPVHHNLDGVFFVLIQLDGLGEVVEVPIHPHPDVTGAAGGFKLLLVLPLAAADGGGHHLDAGARP